MGLNERQIRAVMYVKEKEKIANREYQVVNNISRQVATIDLSIGTLSICSGVESSLTIRLLHICAIIGGEPHY